MFTPADQIHLSDCIGFFSSYRTCMIPAFIDFLSITEKQIVDSFLRKRMKGYLRLYSCKIWTNTLRKGKAQNDSNKWHKSPLLQTKL